MTEKKYTELYFRVTINANFEDFPTLKEAQDYITKVWDEKTFYASLRAFRFRLKNGK